MGSFTKAIVLSDLHLGEEEGFLYTGETLSEQARDNLTSLRDQIQAEGPLDELIILGDFLDLSVASFHEAVINARHFFKAILDGTNIGKIYLIPGNHDHHLWVELVEQDKVVKPMEEGGTPVGEPEFIDLFVDQRFEDTYLSGLLPDKHENPPLIVKYPHHLRQCDNRWYLFFHGHFLEETFTPINLILEPGRLAELEAFNTLWLEAFWYHVGQAGRLRERVEKIYDDFKAGNKAEMNRLADEIIRTLKKRLDAPWWVNTFLDFLKWFVKVVLKYYKPSRRAGLAGKELGEHQRQRIAEYISRYVLRRYTADLGFAKEIPHPFAFIYGHTHRPHLRHHLTINEKVYPLANTGGWLRSDAPDGSTAGILVIEEAGPRWIGFHGKLR